MSFVHLKPEITEQHCQELRISLKVYIAKGFTFSVILKGEFII